jgi:hypothetical protein
MRRNDSQTYKYQIIIKVLIRLVHLRQTTGIINKNKSETRTKFWARFSQAAISIACQTGIEQAPNTPM